MPTTSIICGTLLVLIGIIGYAYGLSVGGGSLTALIPVPFGLLLIAFGIASNAKENLRKHMMHAAAVVALLGFLATAGRLLSKIGSLTLSPAVLSTAAMALICLVFLIFAIRSFIAARRDRPAA